MQVSDGICPKYRASQERLAATRAVERFLSEVCLIWSTTRLLEACAPVETKKDFVFHLRSILEHAPTRDRQDVSLASRFNLERDVGMWGCRG